MRWQRRSWCGSTDVGIPRKRNWRGGDWGVRRAVMQAPPPPAPLHSPGAFEEQACFPLPCLRPRLPANNRGWGQHWCLSPFPLHDSQLQLGQRGLGPRGSELDRSCAEPHRPTSQRLLRWVSDVSGARGSMAGVAAWCERAGGRGPPCPLSLQALTGSNHSPGYDCCSAQ